MCAKRRMFSLDVIDTDSFMDMALSTQALYFHLAMRGDDDGFVSNPNKIIKMIGCQIDELKMLLAKKFIIGFESGVVVIKHWKIHNYIQSDRYTKTQWIRERELLKLDENTNKYSLKEECIQNANKMDTQVRLGKVRLGEVNRESTREKAPTPKMMTKEFFDNKTIRDLKVDKLISLYNLPDDFIKKEIDKFVAYWTELNGSGKKQRWEMERTFEVDRRMSTWFLRANSFGGVNKSKVTII